MAARAQVLDALWWRVGLSVPAELLLTLVLCDGWSFDEACALRWRDVDFRRHFAVTGDEARWLLPHTAGLLAELRRQPGDDSPWASATRDELLQQMREGWKAVVAAAKPPGRGSRLPTWDPLLARVDR